MTGQIAKTTTAMALVLMTSGTVFAEDAKYDKSIEAAAIEKAAQKIGQPRPTIGFTDKPKIITKQDLVNAAAKRSSLVPAKSWEPPKADPNANPRISGIIEQNLISGLDMTTTAGITKSGAKITPKIIWEKFDRDGNPID